MTPNLGLQLGSLSPRPPIQPPTHSPTRVTDRISNVTQLKEPLILLILLSPQVFPTSINVATSHPEAKAKNLSVAIYSSSQVSLSAPHAPQQSSVGPVHSASRGHTWSSSLSRPRHYPSPVCKGPCPTRSFQLPKGLIKNTHRIMSVLQAAAKGRNCNETSSPVHTLLTRVCCTLTSLASPGPHFTLLTGLPPHRPLLGSQNRSGVSHPALYSRSLCLEWFLRCLVNFQVG